MANTRYETLKYDTHYLALRYHWGINEIYNMELSKRKDYIDILIQYDESEREALEEATK